MFVSGDTKLEKLHTKLRDYFKLYFLWFVVTWGWTNFHFICFVGECVQEILGLTAYEYGCGDWKCVLLIGKWMGYSRRALKVDLFVILEFFNSIIYLVGFIRAELASRLRTYVFNVEMCCARAIKSGKNRLNTSLWPKSLTWAFSKQKILQI